MVPLPNFTTYNRKTKEKTKTKKKLFGKFLCILRKLVIPPSYYKDLNDKDFSPFLQIVKNENEFFNIPSMEAAINAKQ